MNAASAAARLARFVAAEEDPVLSSAALADLLTLAQRPDENGNLPTNVASAPVWVTATTYAPGDVVQPSPADGRWWRCAIGGTSASTQPTWPDNEGDLRTGDLVVDGTVTWEDAGAAWAGTYDLAAAAAEGWEQKASLAAPRFQFTTDGQMFFRQQIHAHCKAQARAYRAKMGTVVV